MTKDHVTVFVSPFAYALLNAGVTFAGRDWRRIKREMRKAGEKAK